METTSYWRQHESLPRFSKIKASHQADVVVVGAGITGITAAYLLKRAGHSVALLERGKCGGFDTANTTAHLTCVTDTRLADLVEDFGPATTKAIWDAGQAAIDQILRNIRKERIDCDFAWTPGYYHATGQSDPEQERALLQKDADIARELGIPAKFLESVPLMEQCGIEFRHQAKFNPLQYLAALLRAIPGEGSLVFENSEVEEIQGEPLLVKSGAHEVRCSYLVLATHNPLMGKAGLLASTLFQTKLSLYTSYAVGARIPSQTAPEACFWDTGDPYSYLRVDRHRGFDYAILGGEDHKTGQTTDTPAAYERLTSKLHQIFPRAPVDSRWSGQVIETPDGLPYLGETAPRQFVATGFAGNGLTFGTLGAMMAVDAFEKRRNPWQQLFDVHRKAVTTGAADYLQENKDYPFYLLRGWLTGAESEPLSALGRNQGKVLRLGAWPVAAYRDEHGKTFLCSAVCTHLKCIVVWNEAEKTWDCPCHGSRFDTAGKVLSGPAEEPLEPVQAPEM